MKRLRHRPPNRPTCKYYTPVGPLFIWDEKPRPLPTFVGTHPKRVRAAKPPGARRVAGRVGPLALMSITK